MASSNNFLEELWSDDLLSRRREADLLQRYIEVTTERGPLRLDKRSLTLAVDAGYGEGKTFFLRRLARQLGNTHPVAYVDAWADDISDDPLAALAATLRLALEPLLAEPTIREKFDTFCRKAGRVAAIAGLGLIRRGAGLLITAGSVEAVSHVLDGAADEVKDAIDDSLADVGKGAAEDVSQGVTSLPLAALGKRMHAFELGRKAVEQMQRSLESLVASLVITSLKSPIIIIVDELDRCRPTYAVKLLEEIKHLFDVPNVVFILGTHSGQLAHSVAGSYGPGFDGGAYLRRFVDRQYRLATPSADAFVAQLLRRFGISDSQFAAPRVRKPGYDRPISLPLPELIAEYARVYGVSIRDLFTLVDMLSTSAAISDIPLTMPYLLPLIIGKIQGLPTGTLPKSVARPKWAYAHLHRSGPATTPVDISIESAASHIADYCSWTDEQLMSEFRSDAPPPFLGTVVQSHDFNAIEGQSLSAVESYPQLIEAVARLSPTA